MKEKKKVQHSLDSDGIRLTLVGLQVFAMAYGELDYMACSHRTSCEMRDALTPHNDWLQQRIAANSVTSRLDSVQVLREVLQRGIEILEGGR